MTDPELARAANDAPRSADRGDSPSAAVGAVHRLDDHRARAQAHEPERQDSAELLARARRHDPAALRELFDRHKDRVAGQIQRMIGDPAAVDDLVQEVFIAAFANLGSFRGDSQLRTWLYRIATNKVRNWWDSDQRRRRRERRSAELPQPEPLSPDDDLAAREHRERLYQAMTALSAKLREAFVVRVIEGMSLHEASEVLGVPISTVSYRTRRAEELLCKALDIPGYPQERA